MENNISSSMQHLLEALKKSDEKGGIPEAKPGEAVIEVPLLTSSVASLYERMRSIVDNKEQHLIRWHTIHRTLKRLLRSSSDEAIVATELLKELVADGFLPNNAVPLTTVRKLQYILLKYRVVQKKLNLPELFTIVVSEVESMLYGNRNEVFVAILYETVREAVSYEDSLEQTSQNAARLDMRIYLACRRALLEDDESALLYGVWMKHFPEWERLVDVEGKEIKQIPSVLQFALEGIADPTYRRIARKLRDQAIYVMVLRGLLEQNREVFSDGSNVEKTIAKTVARMSEEQSGAVQTMGMRAFWYILITKTAVILPVEYFFARLFFPPVEMFPLLVNLVFHPSLLLVMTRTIRAPKHLNTDMIVSGVEHIIAGEPVGAIRIKSRKGLGIGYIALYLAVVLAVFSLLVFSLGKIGFTSVSIFFFIILLAVISFFAFRVRTKAKKFVLRRYEEMQPSSFWFSVVTVPFIDAGRRLSDGFRAINIFTELMDIFIEIPFKTLIKTISDFLPFAESVTLRILNFLIISPIAFLLGVKKSFSSFIKEKKEEID